MTRAAFLTLCVTLVSINEGIALDVAYEAFKIAYARNYSEAEHKVREEVFKANAQNILAHNAQFDAGNATFRMGVNQFADWTTQELMDHLVNYDVILDKSPVNDKPYIYYGDELKLPNSFDARESGYYGKIRDPGLKGSAAVEAIVSVAEYMASKLTKSHVTLSWQQFYDCLGTKKATVNDVLTYISMYGIQSNETYPNISDLPSKCRHNYSSIVVESSGQSHLGTGEFNLKNFLYHEGPYAVSIDVTPDFFFYSDGIYSSSECRQRAPNHMLVAIGYGKQSGRDFWTLQNSWGELWGLNGYVKFARNHSNMCGIAMRPIRPTVRLAK